MSDNLEQLKQEESELLAKLNAIRKEKDSVISARRQKEEEEKLAAELARPVTIKILSYAHGKLQVQFEERSDIRAIIRPASSWVREKFFSVKDWDETQDKYLVNVPNLSYVWEGDSWEKYLWHKNAPQWNIDVTITADLSCAMGPDITYSYEMERIPGWKKDWAKKMYTIPHTECWRIPKALEKFQDVAYSDAARVIIFGEIEKRVNIDAIASKTDSDVLKDGLGGMILRPHQRVGVEFGMATQGRFLLADDTGIGKTAQALGFAELMRKARNGSEKAFQTVYIAKAANIPNVIREIVKLTGVEPMVITAGFPSAMEMKSCVVDRYPYLVISYDTIGSKQYTERDRPEVKRAGSAHHEWNKGFYAWSELFQTIQPDLIILDEAHQIKNSSTHRFRAVRPLALCEHVIAMTASPILNRTQELWTLLHMVNPMLFDSAEKFEQRYVGPSGSVKHVESLHELIRPMFLRRKRKDVMKDLPPINRIVRFHTLSPRAEKVYKEILSGIYTALEHYDPKGIGGNQSSVMGVLSQIGRLKQVCAADKVEYSSELAAEIAEESDKRILIFSQYKGSALSIAQRLGSEAVCTVVRTPDRFDSMNPVERDTLFESVRGDPKIKYVVTTTAAQEGHNLEFCNVTIFNDPFWTPEGHRQCEGRAYGRLSNPHPIDSYYIVADVDIEKWIMELLDKKLGIIEEAVDGVENSREVFGSIAMELIRLVKDSQLRQAAKFG
jgi:SNF2 family DNA or RNA helicase